MTVILKHFNVAKERHSLVIVLRFIFRRLVFPVIIFGLGFAISLSLPQHVKEQQEQHRKAPLAKDFDDNDVNLSLYEQFEYRENDTTFDSATPFRSFYDADNEVGYTFDVVPDIIHLVR